MEAEALHVVRHGEGRPVVVLHGAGVDHRESEACFEPLLDRPDLRRVYVDLPGMGRSPAPESLRSPDDVIHVLLDFVNGSVTVIGSCWSGTRGERSWRRPWRRASPSWSRDSRWSARC